MRHPEARQGNGRSTLSEVLRLGAGLEAGQFAVTGMAANRRYQMLVSLVLPARFSSSALRLTVVAGSIQANLRACSLTILTSSSFSQMPVVPDAIRLVVSCRCGRPNA